MQQYVETQLAINGGTPVRAASMPPRFAMGPDEEAAVAAVFAYYRERDSDFGYQGIFEEHYCQEFADFMGGGYADAVATGTAALFVALAALDLPKNSEVLVSPITDPGTLSSIILLGLRPRLVDSAPGSYNIGYAQVEAAMGPSVSCLLMVHATGQGCADTQSIVTLAHSNGIKVLEDCSQAHGATVDEKLVGTFGDIAAFSTMYRKAHASGASGGLVYSQDKDLYHTALAHADRGKPRWLEGFNDRDPAQFLFPALNLHTDEISCAIGSASLSRLLDSISHRQAYVAGVAAGLSNDGGICCAYPNSHQDSPFFLPVLVNIDQIENTKTAFANAILSEGIGLNPHYDYLVSDWPWVQPYLVGEQETPNARAILERSFNLYLNENYGVQEVDDTLQAIRKVSAVYGKS